MSLYYARIPGTLVWVVRTRHLTEAMYRISLNMMLSLHSTRLRHVSVTFITRAFPSREYQPLRFRPTAATFTSLHPHKTHPFLTTQT